jgi:hypothetical protein
MLMEGHGFTLLIVPVVNDKFSITLTVPKFNGYYIKYRMTYESYRMTYESYRRFKGLDNVFADEIKIDDRVFIPENLIETELVVWDKMYYPVKDADSILMTFILTVL